VRLIRVLAAILVLAVALAVSAREPSPGGQERVGERREAGGIVVPTGQLIRPAGSSVDFAGRPIDLVVAPNGKHVYVKDDRGIIVVDAGTWSIKQELKLSGEGGSMHGIAMSRDGQKLYVTGAGSTLYEGAVAADGQVKWGRSIVF